ncbi:DUF2341 domain-containing protein [Reichenbachiella ulvae]|uniref:DUF2341 domain-containing protein n=1 Tax=Reichenbachiella ulvae TaxID=2980104 RepID=A0ABT3CP04_9BACT|nr:DUF2341 domain-containing protein [Reichenbachiella ulvae]MCV9385185.1 DUF2341 domain-containing protein [Reichenbachiella ulvae]
MNLRIFALSFLLLFSSLAVLGQTLSSLYNHNVTITVDKNMVSGSSDLTNFPLLVSLEGVEDMISDPDGISDTNSDGEILSNGFDIVFAPSPSSVVADVYSHYLESYDGVNGDVIIWVKVDLSATVNTEIEMFYGRSGETDQSNGTVWTDANFIGVWQLSETPGASAIVDATGNSLNGTANNMDATNIVSSVVGNGYSFDGTTEYITVPDNTTIEPANSFTISCWFQTSGTQNAYAKMFSKGRLNAPYASYTLEMRPNGGGTNNDEEIGFQTGRTNGNYVLTDTNGNGEIDITSGNWNYFVGVIEESGENYTQTTYLNGELITSSTEQSTSPIDYYTAGGDYDLTIGGIDDGGLNNAFTGIIDELRIANVVRTQDYIKTELRNTACVSNYMTIETLGGLSCTDASLPVEFFDVQARRVNNEVIISWSTAMEENNDYFTIEKSLDNSHYEAIATIDGAGQSSDILDYQFTDPHSPEGLIYYRIKQTDYDGSSAYSKIMKVTGQFQNGSTLSIYPNPALSSQVIKFSLSDLNTEQIELSLTSISGQIVYSETIQNTKRNLVHEIKTNHLPTGTYILSVVSQHQSFGEKVIIQ